MKREGRPAGSTTAPASISTAIKTATSVATTVDHIEHFQRRVLIDAVCDAWAGYWERRARAFEAARPQPGDFTGKATREELSARWRELTAVAAACRARAQVSPLELIEPDVDNVLEEMAG